LVQPLSFKRHRFALEVIRYAVWLYFRFTLSLRDVGELLAERGMEVSREAIRCVYNTFNLEPHLVSRPGLRTLRAQAHQAWIAATQAA
jgi:putative transposase